MRRALLPLATVALLSAPAVAHADASWRLEQPAPPAGAPYKVPLGRPGDLSCWSATRCLLAVEGNAVVPQGLLAYDGSTWTQLSTVCGGSADTTRIAWAGPDELWTITAPSPPRSGGGLGLCHFVHGQVVASYSTPPESTDPFRVLTSAACNGPSDCWFAGVGSQDPTGQRVGGYHLHWDGSELTSVYAPQGRGVSDVVFSGDRFYESLYDGIQKEDRVDEVSLAEPETFFPQLIHTITNGVFADAPFAALARPGVPFDGTELLAADATPGNGPWFVGGGAASGPDAPASEPVARPPIAVELTGDRYREMPLDVSAFGPTDRFSDVAAVPGGNDAWVTVQSYDERGSTTARGRVAHIANDGSVSVQRLPSSGAGRGAAARVEFTGPNEGWMITNGGWLFHYTDGTTHAPDTDPAFARLITFRPNESVAQSIPDAPPADDSQLFAPPEVPAEPDPTPPKARTIRLKPLMFKLSKPDVDRKLRLRMSFSLRRVASVQLQARRKGKVVAKTKLRRLKPGRHELTLQLNRRRWPDGLRFVTKEAK
ncbi:MAG TPA: hypothetical protein VGM91_01925 [Conexibacter sp.]|jgi:hypothetical protein